MKPGKITSEQLKNTAYFNVPSVSSGAGPLTLFVSFCVIKMSHCVAHTPPMDRHISDALSIV